MRRNWTPLAVSAAILASSCAYHDSFVKVDDVALGRVVVYRNGVAYYERKARVDGDELTVTVPQDKVDDFLKSLTVVDAKSGKPMAVSFPRRETLQGNNVEMTIQLPKKGADLKLTYITEAPAWKPSYRVQVKSDGKVTLQGWAIVDNTSGEDWKDIFVGVGSSSALSFRYDLWSIRSIQRETLQSDDRFAIAPPMGGSPHRELEGEGSVLDTITDADIPRPADHPDVTMQTTTGSSGPQRYVVKKEKTIETKPGDTTAAVGGNLGTDQRSIDNENRMKQVAQNLRSSGSTIVIEGYRGPNETDDKALDRANLMRNELIDEGVAPAQLRVEGKGNVSGIDAGVRLVVAENDGRGGQAGAAAASESDTPVGESHFTSATPMTVKRSSSVMVSIVQDDTDGEVLYLYDPESARGNAHFAFRAVRFRNPTESTLETGPLTVYGDGRFIGEGLAEPIPPKATAVVPFALDREVLVSSNDGLSDRIDSLVTLERGVLTANMQHVKTTKLKLTNRLDVPSKVLLRHTVEKGWKLLQSPKQFDALGDAHLFEVALKAGETREVEIEEATPIVKTVDLRSPLGVDLVEVYLSGSSADPHFAEQMKQLLAIHRELADREQQIDLLRQTLADYRERMDELHVQLVTLEAVKSKGELMTHLKQKLKEISDRVQKATIDLVDQEQQAMLARIKFQDGVAELTLEKRVAEGTK